MCLSLFSKESKLCNCFWYLVQAAFKNFTNKCKIIPGYYLEHSAEGQIQPKCMKLSKNSPSTPDLPGSYQTILTVLFSNILLFPQGNTAEKLS